LTCHGGTERRSGEQFFLVQPQGELAMKTFARLALAIAAATLFTGCAELQPPIAAPGAIPQTAMSLPGSTSGQDLLYIDNYYALYVYTFPQGQQQATGAGYILYGECADASGNVYIAYQTISGGSEVLKYAHGQTEPEGGLPAKGYVALTECSSDPSSGNLAATGPDTLEIFPTAKYPPNEYTYPEYFNAITCSYDDSGNLFIDGTSHSQAMLLELPKGKRHFVRITLPSSLATISGYVRWDGTHLALGAGSKIYRLAIHARKAKIAGTTRLRGLIGSIGSFWIQDGDVVGATGSYTATIWKYPGGRRLKVIYDVASGSSGGTGVTVSVAPSR
jgi:hypothetical protein